MSLRDYSCIDIIKPLDNNILTEFLLAGNVGNLPIILVQGVCANENTIFQKDLPGDECEEKGIAYVAFAMWVASTFQFCVAINLMAKKNPELPIDIEAKGSIKARSYWNRCRTRVLQMFSLPAIYYGFGLRKVSIPYCTLWSVISHVREHACVYYLPRKLHIDPGGCV